MSIGGSELIVVFLLALIFFGPKKLPEIGRSVGQAMRELRRMSNEVTSAFEEAMDDRGRYSSSNSSEWDQPDDESVSTPPEAKAEVIDQYEALISSDEDAPSDDPYGLGSGVDAQGADEAAGGEPDTGTRMSQDDQSPDELPVTEIERTAES